MACWVSRAVTSKSGLLAEASTSGPAVVTIEVPDHPTSRKEQELATAVVATGRSRALAMGG